MSEHPSYEEIEALAFELPATGDSVALTEHVRGCEPCRAIHRELQAERSVLDLAMASVSLPPKLADRLSKMTRQRRPRAGSWVGSLAAVACFACVALSVALFAESSRIGPLEARIAALQAVLPKPAGSDFIDVDQVRNELRLGFLCMELSSDQRAMLNLPAHQGILVIGILKGSTLEKSLQAGDVILSVNNRPIDSREKLSRSLTQEPGGDLTLTVLRDCETTRMTVPRY